jgi:hypothetical protein
VFPVLPPPELPQPAATAAHAKIAPALASFLFTIFLLRRGGRWTVAPWYHESS